MGTFIKKKGFAFLLFSAFIFALFGSSVFLFSFNVIKASALGTDPSTLIVQKISRVATDLNEDGYIYDLAQVEFPAPGAVINYPVYNQDFVMLNNNQEDISLQNESPAENIENILVTFGSEGSIYWLSVTAKLNGVAINTANTITETTVNGSTVKRFLQVLDLKTLTNINLQPFESLEGYYEYIFNYRYLDSSGQVSEELVKNIGFFVLDESTYINVSANDTETVIPKLFNTQKIDRNYYASSYYIEHNYFNYNNFNTTDEYDYIEGGNNDVLFPTFIYDASRYQVSYTKILYGVTSTVNTKFEIIGGEGKVSYYLNNSPTAYLTHTVLPTTIGSETYYFYDNFRISNIGNYTFSVNYLFKQSDSNFIASKTAKMYEASIQDNDILLNIFGYQMYYAKDNTGEAEFKGYDNSSGIMYITDYSKDNETFEESYTDTDGNGEYTLADTYIDNDLSGDWSLGDTLVIDYNENGEWDDAEPYVDANSNGIWDDAISYANSATSLNITTSANIASTNQAPIFLKSFASLKYNESYTNSYSFYHYYASGIKTGTPQKITYTNNTRFTQNGYYELVVFYDFQEYQILKDDVATNSSTTLHMQVFAFKIANLPPTVSLKTNTNEVITNGKYTNANYVTANWSASGIFDVAPSATLWRQNFDGFNPYTQPLLFNGTYDNVNGTSYTANQQITNNGHYTLQVFYGPSRSTSIIYKFTIDKNPISNFKVIGVSSGTDDDDNILYLREDALDLTNDLIINTPFTLDWSAKSSGATISAKYSFTSISEKNGATITSISDNDEIWITNGYETKSTFTNLNYYKTTATESGILTANSVLKDASIYYFTLTDQAGNNFYYYVVLDNTQAKIIQDPAPVSIYNFVPTTTTLTWGTHKAIEVSLSSNLTAMLNNSSLDTTIFKTYNGKNYLLVPIDNVVVNSASLDDSTNFVEILNFTKGESLITPSVTFYTGYETSIPVNKENVTGEKIYHTYITDNSYISYDSDLTFENTVLYKVTMNLDRSQGTAQTYGVVKSSSDNSYYQQSLDNVYLELLRKRASNRQFLYFYFKDATDDYKIESLTYNFYPLTFDEASPYYPFASTPSLTEMDILTTADLITIGSEFYRTKKINSVYSTQYGKEVTMPGMYVITRTYVGDESIFSDTGDNKVKQYIYYMDRYNIIEQLDSKLIGEYIALILGEVEGRTPVEFDDFLINTTKETLLETNLLPVVLELPQNKYSAYDSLTDSYSSGISSFDLVAIVSHSYKLPNGVNVTKTISQLDVINGRIILPELYKDGTYTVLIKDKAGYDTTLIGSNEFTFKFMIKNNKPSALFYGTKSGTQDIALMNITSTNDTNLKLSWNDPEDVYTAKVDANNLTVTQQLKNMQAKTVIYKIVDGIVTVNTYGISLVSTEIGTIIGSDNIMRNHYDLQIFTTNDALSQIEATYEVTIQYEGLEQHYIYDGNNFFTNKVSMTIDRTPPSYNLNRLITADTYLSAAQKEIIKNKASEINTENYAFAITNSFTFQRATGTSALQDTNLIYYRKYNKYVEGEENLQSLIPGDANYNNYLIEPTRPRFNTTNIIYTLYGYGLGAFMEMVSTQEGGYYEIIEIDEAGNHTIYTVQTFAFGHNLQGIVLLEQPQEGEEPEYDDFNRNSSEQSVLDALYMEVTSIISSQEVLPGGEVLDLTDDWYTVIIKNKITNVTTELKHTPNTIEENFISQINSILEVTDQIKITGASFNIRLINRINKGFSFDYNIQGEALAPTFVDLANSFTITLPTDTASTNIETFRVYRSQDGDILFNDSYRVYYDMNGLSLNQTGISAITYEFEAGEYYFYFQDNFNRTYYIPHIFGLQDIADVSFEGPTAQIGDILYTANDVLITYQVQLYSVSIKRNGLDYIPPSNNISLNQETGISQILLKDITKIFPIPEGQNGLNDSWQITIKNSAGNETKYNFNIYTKSPILYLTDSLDNSLNHILEFSTTKSVYINYENTPILPYTATLKLDRLNENNAPITIEYDSINPEFGYYLSGTYTLSFQNLLGHRVQYTWVVQESATVVYSVIANINGFERAIATAGTKYDYNGTLIDQYFTKYTYRVDKNPDRNLTLSTLSVIGTVNTGITTIYSLQDEYGLYNKVFAVTKVPTSSNFMGTNLLINEYYRGGTRFKTVTNPTTVSWNANNIFDGNYIYVEYYFNGTYVGKIIDSTITLEDAGIYYLQFYDLAGNMQLFGNENYYKIILVNEVLFSMNGIDPVEDMIYNDSVSLKIEQVAEYLGYPTPPSIVVTRNGASYTPLKVNNSYIFTDFGLYQVTLTARVRPDDEDEVIVITKNYSFMILNQNEAKLSFEYSPQTGYEILSVVKDGINVTNQFKQTYNSNTLTRIFLSKEEGGNGNYTITVKANYLTLKPSQTFTFNVWVNNETPMILSSISEGTTTTKNITLTFNKYLIYQQVGESVIKVNGEDAIIINAETSSSNILTSYQLTENDVYLIQLQTNMGNTVLSFKVIKKAPLNAVAIILIIVGSLVVVGLTVTFILLRTRMKVS